MNVAEALQEEMEAISEAGNAAYEVVRKLPSPRAAALALCGALTMIIEDTEGIDAQERVVKDRLKDIKEQVIHCWRERREEEKAAKAAPKH